MTEPITTVVEFIAWIKALQGRMILYRGLANADWEVESSAYRRMIKAIEISSEILPAVTFQNYIDHLLDEAGLQGFRERQDRRLSDLELLAELQHYGAATCLIDFTTSALIALYFACREETDKAGKVIALATDDIHRFSTISYEDLNKPIKEFLNQGRLWKWEPSGLNNRIVAQQSVLVFGEGRIEKNYYKEVTIAAAFKRAIIETLEKSFGISERKLFNDLAGFADINAHDQPYDKFSAEDFYYLGVTFHQRGEFDQAIERYDRAIVLDPRNAGFYNNRGIAKGTLEDFHGAIADFNIAIDLNPQDAAAYNNRGNATSALGDHQEAIVDFNKAIDLDPQEAGAYNNRGNAKKASGNLQGAIADFSKAIELNPQEAMAYSNRGTAKREQGDRQGAISDYNKAIELNPKYAAAYNNRGAARGDSGDYQGAIADYNKAIELEATYATAYNNRGSARRALGDHQKAITDYDKAIELNPEYSDAFYKRGTAKGESGDYHEAIADFSRAIELNPRNAMAYYNRGIAKRSIGDEAGAIKDFAKASEIDPSLHPPKS